jgi:hypothetical protein
MCMLMGFLHSHCHVVGQPKDVRMLENSVWELVLVREWFEIESCSVLYIVLYDETQHLLQ